MSGLHWGRFSPSTVVSPSNHSTNCSTHSSWAWYNRPVVALVLVDPVPFHPKEKTFQGEHSMELVTRDRFCLLLTCSLEIEICNKCSNSRLPLWSSDQFLATDPEVQVWFPALPDVLRSSGSGTESTQPREYTWGATWKKNSGSCLEIWEYGLTSRSPVTKPNSDPDYSVFIKKYIYPILHTLWDFFIAFP
jgi:hypothetical protein